MKRVLLSFACVAVLVGCAQKSNEPVSKLTEAQRDTALSRSDLPGSAAVGRAFDAADQAKDHATKVDSLPQ
ncbi:MAG: hypothetical protein K8R56_08440 [Candidatus Eisenbacteria bacterium]|nr:hypothetical protein [Candidatus Eisenbacteria bacterium]